MTKPTANNHSVLLVGGPDAGKTNFLIRLWIALQSGEGRLQSDGLPEDMEYLNAGAQTLLGGEFAPRTSREVHTRNVIPVRATSNRSDFRGQLVVPDSSGEEWMLIHRNREWSERWEEAIPSLLGCLLFVRAGSLEIHAPLDWVSCFDYFGTADNLPDAPDSDGEEFAMPTQVVLIDWLQCLRAAVSAHGGGSLLRVGVIVSAWDRVPTEQQGEAPQSYVAKNFPMFHDFILSNRERFAFECFGVSIVGGDFEFAPGFRENYLRGVPAQAGYVVHALGGVPTRTGDHTLPLAWAMGLVTESAVGRDGAVP
ncbi:hypothetical protein SAMN05444166_0212 [Singulisphaera sp. GP187]|uniref:TRAFAC clade GTPase domain-containing protein n=1 Tax=Singulisphaera sp. GP187 TaxID=1882752 RepID=UPI000929FED7|nr:hypothetical protein [Singulisphaera sp. GP187]SIN69861.1 hypothetical protein SAMN05444166_0212 [Singulisphaera sp. GP187]